MDNLEKQVKKNKKKNKPKRYPFVLIGLLILLIGGGSGWYFGSQEGQKLRSAEKDKVVIDAATTQFHLGVRELEEGRYDNAKKRFEYVIKLRPDFPGAQEKLTEVLVAMSIVNTPTPIPLPTLTPTPDFRGEEELFNQAWQYVLAKDWNNAILTLDLLRDKNLNFQPVQVDGMYYISLRNRGVYRILQEGSLEPGMYDLALSERFAPLDNEADSYRVWARYYLNGASYWGLDWSQVVSIFAQLYPAFPNLHDSSGMTAQERYRLGLLNWGDDLALKEDFCLAKEKYDMAFAFFVDEKFSPKATAIYEACEKSKETEAPEVINTPSPTPTLSTTPGGPTDTPEPTPDGGGDSDSGSTPAP